MAKFCPRSCWMPPNPKRFIWFYKKNIDWLLDMKNVKIFLELKFLYFQVLTINYWLAVSTKLKVIALSKMRWMDFWIASKRPKVMLILIEVVKWLLIEELFNTQGITDSDQDFKELVKKSSENSVAKFCYIKVSKLKLKMRYNLFVTSKIEFSYSPIHEFKVLQNDFKIKKARLKMFFKVCNK